MVNLNIREQGKFGNVLSSRFGVCGVESSKYATLMTWNEVQETDVSPDELEYGTPWYVENDSGEQHPPIPGRASVSGF